MEKQTQDKKEPAKLIRIMSTDIPGDMNIYSGLTRIKGVSWSFSNALCKKLGFEKDKKIQELSNDEMQKIIRFFENPDLPEFLLNTRKDFEDGKDKHLLGSDLELKRDFNIKRLRKIRSYKGLRHASGQPVRGQRTKAHFRENKTMGVGRKKVKKSGK